MLLVRRTAPEGSYFTDGDRASGVFGVLATGFSVLLGFIIFLAFTSYDQSRTRRRDRGARRSSSRSRRRSSSRRPAATELTGQLVCYARIGRRRRVGADGERHRQGDALNPWGVALFDDGARRRAARPRVEQSAYDKWLEQTSTREEARRDRVHGAEGVIPTPLWIVLFFISGVIFVYMLFFADRGEGRRDPGDADGLGHVGDRDDAAPAARSSTARSTRASAACSPSRWSGRCEIRRRGARGDRRRGAIRRATRGAAALSADERRDRPASSSSRRSCSRSRPSRRPGAATRRAAGTASRRRRSAARQRRARRVDARSPTSPTRRRRSTSRSSRSGSTPTRSDETELARLLLRALPPRVQARGRRLDRDEAAQEPERAADARSRCRSTSSRRATRRTQLEAEADALGRDGAGERPALDQLRARRRPVRGRALLRRHEHEAPVAAAAPCDARDRRGRLPRDARLDRDVPRQRLGLAGLRTRRARPRRGAAASRGCSRPRARRRRAGRAAPSGARARGSPPR